MKKERSLPNAGPRIRVQMDFNSAEIQRLRQMQQITGVPTRNALIKDALNVYEWILAKTARNSDLHVPKEDLKAIVHIREELSSADLADNNPQK